ncbi:MAG TPA: hypothetical protein VHT53_02780 [Candidatus Elarobacter sp.]|nr:hypothetical protein [Candidatus Elarobacter sp.]
MHTTIFSRTTLAIAVMTMWGAVPAVVKAQPQPQAPVPTYARPAPRGAETIHGTIASISDAYHILVRDDRGFMDYVDLHQGTVINPRGLRLLPGMRVTIYGTNQGSTFLALDIDAPDEYGVAQQQANVYDYGIYPGYDWGPYLYDVGSSIITAPAPSAPAPAPTAAPVTRRIEPPNPNMPVQRVPLNDGKPQNASDPDAQASPAPSDAPAAPSLPSYGTWFVGGMPAMSGGWAPIVRPAPASRSAGASPQARSAGSSSGSSAGYRAPLNEPRSQVDSRPAAAQPRSAPAPVERSAPAPIERSAPPPVERSAPPPVERSAPPPPPPAPAPAPRTESREPESHAPAHH